MENSSPKVYINSDHRGFALRKKICENFPEFIDLGGETLDKNDDYNDSAVSVVKEVLKDPENSFGILICGSAIGVSIQSNRFKKIRAAIVEDEPSAKLTREHNDSNVLCLSADKIGDNPEKLSETFRIIKAFLETPFSAAPRHLRRVEKLDKNYLLEEN
ncbi:RpiB/LacA/LacB family sugar-phosphate isomerase [Candidatus Saccharibacteria bacterium]|nr:RpiB/LacA/LacB family sugar-phosphate isomerase [Candidatus Saccharibacteria bacterium]